MNEYFPHLRNILSQNENRNESENRRGRSRNIAESLYCNACKKLPECALEAPCCGRIYCWLCVHNVGITDCLCGSALYPASMNVNDAAQAIINQYFADRDCDSNTEDFRRKSSPGMIDCRFAASGCLAKLLPNQVEEHERAYHPEQFIPRDNPNNNRMDAGQVVCNSADASGLGLNFVHSLLQRMSFFVSSVSDQVTPTLAKIRDSHLLEQAFGRLSSWITTSSLPPIAKMGIGLLAVFLLKGIIFFLVRLSIFSFVSYCVYLFVDSHPQTTYQTRPYFVFGYFLLCLYLMHCIL